MQFQESKTQAKMWKCFFMKKDNAWLICFIASLFFFYEFMQMSVFNAIGTQLLKDFSIRVTSLAGIAAAYSYSMVLFLLPAGILLDLFSPKKIIVMAFSLSVIGTFLFSFATTPLYAECCRMISGIGGAFAFLSCIKLATRWFPGNKMSLVIGLIITLAFLGGAVAQTPFTLLTQKIGWKDTLRILASCGILFISLILLFVKDNVDNNCSIKILAGKNNKTPFFKRVFVSLSNLQTWLGAIYIMLMNLPIVLLGTLWGDLYLTEVKNFTHIQASYIDTMLFVGIMIGSPLFGFISDKISRRKIPLAVGSFLTLSSSFLLFFHFTSVQAYIILFFLLGLFSSAQGVGYPSVVENNVVELSGTVSGIASIIIMGGGAFFKILYGWMLDKNWNGVMINKIPYYSHHDFNIAMTILPISFFLSLCSILFIRETFCQRVVNQENDPIKN